VAVDDNIDDEWDSAFCRSVTLGERFLAVDLWTDISSLMAICCFLTVSLSTDKYVTSLLKSVSTASRSVKPDTVTTASVVKWADWEESGSLSCSCCDCDNDSCWERLTQSSCTLTWTTVTWLRSGGTRLTELLVAEQPASTSLTPSPETLTFFAAQRLVLRDVTGLKFPLQIVQRLNRNRATGNASTICWMIWSHNVNKDMHVLNTHLEFTHGKT